MNTEYEYRVAGIKDSNTYFVFRHKIIPAKGRKKAQIYPDMHGVNPVARFSTIEDARAEKYRLTQEQ